MSKLKMISLCVSTGRDRRDKIRYHTVLNYILKRRSKFVYRDDTLEITHIFCVFASLLSLVCRSRFASRQSE